MCQQFAAIERVHQERDGAIWQCLLSNVIVIVGRDHDDRQQHAGYVINSLIVPWCFAAMELP